MFEPRSPDLARALRLAVTVALVAIAACACKPGGKTTVDRRVGDAGVGAGDAAACERARPAVIALYQKELLVAGAEPAAQELARQAVDDNTEMALADCRTDPDRFAPCLASAASVSQLERDCLIPLDEEGRVEGQRFGAGR